MVLILIAVFVGANFVASIVLTWMPSFLYRKFGMSLGAAGFSSTFYLQIASVLGVISGGVLADRLARRRPGGRMMTQAIGLLAGVPFIFITGWTLSVPMLVLALAGFGYFKGLYDANIWASLHDVVPARLRATGCRRDERSRVDRRRLCADRHCAGVGALRHERRHQRELHRLLARRLAAAVRNRQIHEAPSCLT